uniref:Uncharacterized protein n=1 Tax=Cucumis melo TaxID=3656 RepID=A0A9I9E9C8_CUCME
TPKRISAQRTLGIRIFPIPDRRVVKAALEKILFPMPRTMCREWRREKGYSQCVKHASTKRRRE